MCRVILYLGKQRISMYDLIYGPDNALVHQSYAPQLMQHIQNLAGLGFCAWSDDSYQPEQPYYYKTSQLPFFDKNLFHLSKKITANCILAHVRGVEYSIDEIVSEQNAHPFKMEDTQMILAHNGNLIDLPKMKKSLARLIKPEIFGEITGTTDSEWIYAVFLSQLQDYSSDVSLDEAHEAVIKTFKLLRDVRQENGINEASPVNLFITNGKYLLVTRFVYDFGCHLSDVQRAFLQYHSLWVTFGEHYGNYDGVYKMYGTGTQRNILFASEPLTNDRTTWIELPEYSLTKAWMENDQVFFRTYDLAL